MAGSMVVLSAAEVCVVFPLVVLPSVKFSCVGPRRGHTPLPATVRSSILVRRWRPGNGFALRFSPPNVDIVTRQACLTADSDRDEARRVSRVELSVRPALAETACAHSFARHPCASERDIAHPWVT